MLNTLSSRWERTSRGPIDKTKASSPCPHYLSVRLKFTCVGVGNGSRTNLFDNDVRVSCCCCVATPCGGGMTNHLAGKPNRRTCFTRDSSVGRVSHRYCSTPNKVERQPQPRARRQRMHKTNDLGEAKEDEPKRRKEHRTQNFQNFLDRARERRCVYASLQSIQQEFRTLPGAPRNASNPATEYPSPRSSGDRLGAMALRVCCVSWFALVLFGASARHLARFLTTPIHL